MEDCGDNHHSTAGGRKIIFGKYEMGRLLGQGTFAKVYYAKDLISSESVAIKVIKKDQVRKEGLMEQITREISVMRLVRHPNVVELKEVMATKRRVFFVMEYITGGELFAKVVKGKLQEDVARKYFQQLISAVDFCHSRGVSHRDLKPENLLLDANGDLKVSDFGLSALPEQLRNDGLLHTQCGTPAYVAPEVLRRKGYDGATADIWSCGVILYVLLAGFLPFQHENIMHMYKKIFKAEYEFPPWFSVDSRRLISKILMVDPSRRITIPAIMRLPWFLKGFQRPLAFSIKESDNNESKDGGTESEKSKTSPPFYNAFEFISSMSSGFDLSNMFEKNRKSSSLFTSTYSASAIVKKLESAAKKLNLQLLNSKQNEYKVKMQRTSEGRKGKLSVTAEVFAVAPEVSVVEFSKSAGDTLEYKKFCEEDVRPALNDIVWRWQGEDDNN
ncbi:CBL-interacting serine/threonine-protein kinase 5-like [Cynara cardunculus var. scolymus]|uniref:non-specific serine/threonine protein kinase n=1 Tax=Cynara cardunculus var. scolymus TaxID=59895 RepID=A0A118K3K5_CYNCS|nr:CBL-interacting serine/threonine-protein kinase 5-like [Cynara cardunculus var. scolymus]KVI06075.1 Calcium/calmodulin-dependent/calcium-dependent protein kinase [Cynara cardunculus var. scolymus]